MSDESQGHHNPLANVHVPKDAAGVAALLDFGFKKFITLGIIKVLYIVGLALIALACVVFVISGFIGGLKTGIIALVLAPIVCIIYIILFRVWLELIIVIFRIAENTTKLVEIQGGTTSRGGL